jgi:RHS repeat-associated protein
LDSGITVVSANDYYPFGSTMAGRKYNQGTYRYGFNGKEEDKEWGSQMIQDYGFRIYNPTIGKFLSVDPLSSSYPWYTPYQFAGNKPIKFIDLDGLDGLEPAEYEQNEGDVVLEVVEFVAITVRDEIPLIGEFYAYKEEGTRAMIWGILPFGRHIRRGVNNSWKWTKRLFKRKPKKAGVKAEPKPESNLDVNGKMNVQSEITEYNVNTKTHKASEDIGEINVKTNKKANTYTSPTTEELFEIAANQEAVGTPLHKFGKINIYGSAGTQGDKKVYDIFLVEADKNENGENVGDLIKMLSNLSEAAKSSGAKSITINGHSTHNTGILKFVEKAQKNGGTALGWTITGGGSNGSKITLTKVLE